MNRYFAKQKKIHCADTGEDCIGYNEYLKSNHWARLRSEYIPKDMKCSMCHKRVSSLQLHHLTYVNIGNEQADDLLPLCEQCHKLIHQIPKEHIKSKLYYKPVKKKRKKVKRLKRCENCKYKVFIKVGRKKKSEAYCNYYAKFNTTQVCEHFR